MLPCQATLDIRTDLSHLLQLMLAMHHAQAAAALLF